MIRRESGFTLVELLITMVMFVLVMAAASQIFTGLLTQFKQQSKIAETNIEGIIGLDMLRRDLDHAGYGLPWEIPAGTYSEVPAGSAGDAYNECAGPCSVAPRAVSSGSGTGWNGSDELVIRGANVARIRTAQAWTTLRSDDVKINGLSGETFADDDHVIVLSGSTSNYRNLMVNGTVWDTRYDGTSNFDPDDTGVTHVIYGIDDSALLMPFNRADYYISTTDVPSRCASNTGVLMKSVLSQTTGYRSDLLPMLDCVADMQVVFRFDQTVPPDGAADITTDDIVTAGLDAQGVRDQLMDIRAYILAHEGQMDPNFTYATNPVYVGDPSIGSGRNFDFSAVTNPIANWQNYRWKLYTIIIRPINLRQ